MTSPAQTRMNPCASVIPIGNKPAVGAGVARLDWFRTAAVAPETTVITIRPVLDDGTEPGPSFVLADPVEREAMAHAPDGFPAVAFEADGGVDRKSVVEGKRVDLGGRRIIKKQKR